MQRKHKKLIILGGTCVALLAILITMLVLRNVSPAFADAVTMNVTKWWVYVTGHIASVLPFSVFEFFVILAVLLCVIFIILLIKQIVKRNFLSFFKSLLIFSIVALSIVNIYTFTTGFTYFRSPISIPQSAQEYNNAMVIDATEYFLDDYNSLAEKLERDKNGDVVCPYSIKELSDKIAHEFDVFNSDYLFDYTPRVKPIFNSWFMTLTNIGGITFVPFGEANINKDAPKSDIPQIMTHELCHAKGVMREGDCNFISYYILLNSSDDYLRYCGYFSCFGSLISAVDVGEKSNENYKILRAQISPLINKELENAYDFWYSNATRNDFIGATTRLLNNISSFFNNIYLKLNGLNNGTGSYNDKINDGYVTDSGETDPDTGDIIYIVTRTSVQKMFFGIYEKNLL